MDKPFLTMTVSLLELSFAHRPDASFDLDYGPGTFVMDSTAPDPKKLYEASVQPPIAQVDSASQWLSWRVLFVVLNIAVVTILYLLIRRKSVGSMERN